MESDRCSPASQRAEDCESLREASPPLGDVNECPDDGDEKPVPLLVRSVPKFCNPNVYYNNARKGVYRRYSMCDWDTSYEANKQNASDERRVGQLCRATCAGAIRLTAGGNVRECANSKLLGHRAFETLFWKDELLAELKRMEKEILALTHQRTLMERELEDVKAILMKSENCLMERERRYGIDKCRDQVERHLTKEILLLQEKVKQLEAMLAKCDGQLKLDRAVLGANDVDVRNKLHAQQLDERMHRLNIDSSELATCEGVEYQDVSVTTHKSWLKFNKDTLIRARKERERSEVFRGQMEAKMRKVALEIWNCVQKLNRMFAVRIMETSDAQRKLLQHVERTTREKKEMEANVEAIKKAMHNKEELIKLCQTRLEQRLSRLGAENCRDQAMRGLQNEMASLRIDYNILEEKLTEATVLSGRIARGLNALLNDVAIKTQTLQADHIRCGKLRREIHIDPCLGSAFQMPQCVYDNLVPPQC